MRVALHIALRYLFAKKSHNVINIISIISAAGIAIGSMALILILSVYNGFDNSIKSIYESYEADFIISPSQGKMLTFTQEQLNNLKSVRGVTAACPIIEENIFIKYGSQQAIATIKGVDSLYQNIAKAAQNIVNGEFKTTHGEIEQAIVGQDLAHELGLRVKFLTPLEVYFPNKTAEISLLNPLEAINSQTYYPAGITAFQGNLQPNLMYASLHSVQKLTNTPPDNYSAIEIFLSRENGENLNDIEDEIAKRIPADYIIKNKQEQNATLYKMMKAEKFAVYLILFFVILIISINIFSCLSMLITDKKGDIETYLSMGTPKEMVEKIFHLHGFLISALGCVTGVIIGLILAFIQQKFGIISIPGNYLINAFPVEIKIFDIIITLAGVCSVGFIISYLPIKKFFKN